MFVYIVSSKDLENLYFVFWLNLGIKNSEMQNSSKQISSNNTRSRDIFSFQKSVSSPNIINWLMTNLENNINESSME